MLFTPKQAILEWDIQAGTYKLFIPAMTLILQNTSEYSILSRMINVIEKINSIQITKHVTPNIHRPWSGPFESNIQQTRGNLNICIVNGLVYYHKFNNLHILPWCGHKTTQLMANYYD